MKKLKKDKGFTLIELLVALSIVGIILLAFFKVTDITTRMNVKNNTDIKALNLAQSEVENLRNQIKNGEQIESRNYIKSIDGKEFKVSLQIISKSKIYAQNDNLDTGLYMYKINMKVNPCDTYFSEKPTELNNIEILSKNS